MMSFDANPMNVVRSRSMSICGSLVGVAALSLILSGCGITETLTENSKIDYRSAKKGPGLDVPPDLVSPRSDDRYRVPEPTGDRTLSGFQRGQGAPAVQGGPSVLPAVDGVRMERSGTQRWLVVNRPPEAVWPLLRTFWTESGFSPVVESSETGIYETDWAENRAKIPRDGIRKALGKVFDGLYDSGQRDKFRTRIERTKDGTEIYLTHRGMEEVYVNTQVKDRTVWVARPADPELEAEFLRRLMTRLGVSKEAVAAALPASPAAAAALGKPDKAVIQGQGGEQKLNIAEGFDQAWRQLSLALDRGGFTVDDRDRSKGQFFVRYVDPETQAKLSEKPGFFSRVFGGSGSKLDQTERFQLNVVRNGEQQTFVEVRDAKGSAVPEGDRPTVGKILGLLRSQIN